MDNIDGSITEEKDGIKTENFAFTYSEEEKERNEINASTAEKVFSPEFIPYYLMVQKVFSLTQAETLLYGFIRFYMANGGGRFYFTDEQLAKVLDCNSQTIMRSIKTLKDKDIIKVGHKIKAGGGMVRFINNIKIPQNVTFRELQNVTTMKLQKVTKNKNKINENKINNKYIITPVGTGAVESKELKKEAEELTDQQKYAIFIDLFNQMTNRKFTDKDKKAKRQFLYLLKEGYTSKQFKDAINNCKSDSYHIDTNFKYLTPEFITRTDKFERYANQNF